MTIRREDLAAASDVGLLQYRQIEPLLVFLLQREIYARRRAMLAQRYPAPMRRLNTWLSYVAGALALVTTALFVLLFAARVDSAVESMALILCALLYAAALIAWFRRRGFYARLRMLVVLLMASAPLAVLALHHVAG